MTFGHLASSLNPSRRIHDCEVYVYVCIHTEDRLARDGLYFQFCFLFKKCCFCAFVTRRNDLFNFRQDEKMHTDSNSFAQQLIAYKLELALPLENKKKKHFWIRLSVFIYFTVLMADAAEPSIMN